MSSQGLTLPPLHVPRTSPLFSSVFHTATALSAPAGHLPLEGKAIKLSGREGVGFAANIPMTIHAALFSPSFLWKEVPRRGGGWPRETVLPHSGKPTPPRFARLPLPEEGARMIFKPPVSSS